MNGDLVVVQQYLSYKGHYRQYFENLLDAKYNYLYGSIGIENYENSIWIKCKIDPGKVNGIFQKIKLRFWGSYPAYKTIASSDFTVIHFMEFEPLAFLLLAKKINKNRQLIITIHSADKLHFSNWFSNKLAGAQRKLLNFAIRNAAKNGAHFVTHYQCHKERILDVIGEDFRKNVVVIDYPAPDVRLQSPRTNSGNLQPRYLIYGQIREDKGIFEFLQNESVRQLNITIAGRIVDKRILEFSNEVNLTIIDKFLTDEEISDLIDSHDFMLLPYPVEYTNGAGTFKDSLAKGMPVVCSNISIFKEIIDLHGVGLLFENPDQIANQVEKLTKDQYESLSKNCLTYAKKYNWEYMREKYFQLYESVRSESTMTSVG